MAESADFSSAQLRVRKLQKMPTNDELLALYGLYKQGTQGDVRGKRPSALNVVARAKYDAWAARAPLNSDAAQKAYVALVDKLLAKYPP